MAWSYVAGRGGANTKTAGTTRTYSPNATVAVGQVFVVECISDNVSTTTGSTSDHSLSDDAGNTYTKIGEYTNSPTGAAADGITVSAWVTQVTTQLTTTSVVTLTVASSCLVKALAGAEFAIGAGNSISVGTPTTGSASASTSGPSTSLSGLASAEHLFLAFVADEGPSTDTWTADAAFGVASSRGTSGGTADGNAWAHMEQNIATATSMTHQSSLNNARDWAEILVIIDEVSSGPTQYTQEIDVTAGSTATVVKAGQLIKSLSASSSVSLARPATKLVAIAASVGNAVSRILQARKPISVSEGSTVTAQKAASKTLSFSAGTSPSIIKRVTKTVSASVGNSASVVAMRVFLVTISVATGNGVSLLKRVGKPVSVSAGSSRTLSKAASKTLSFSGGTTPSLSKRASKTLSMAASSSLSIVKRVSKTITSTVGNFVTVTVGGAVQYFVELDFVADTTASILLVPQRVFALLLGINGSSSVSIVKRVSKTIAATGSSLLSILRGIYYPGPDPSNQAFTGRSVNDVTISNGPNGVEFDNTSQNNVLIQVSENSITVTEG